MYFWLAVFLLTGSSLGEEDDFRIPKLILDIDKERIMIVKRLIICEIISFFHTELLTSVLTGFA